MKKKAPKKAPKKPPKYKGPRFKIKRASSNPSVPGGF